MTRRHFTFPCHGSLLAGTLDEARGTTGLVIVSGGNEVRSGPWSGQALLADRIAAAGFPVFRFDRRGVGDSEGVNLGFRSNGDDIDAAGQAFRAEVPNLARLVAFGNCDAASALMLTAGKGFDALVLANPWPFDPAGLSFEASPTMTPQRLRGHYLRRLADPRAWLRLLSGKVAISGFASSLRDAVAADAPPSRLHQAMTAGLAEFAGPVALLVAGRDRTGLAFLDHWNRADPRMELCPGATHSFVETDARLWLEDRILAVLRAA